MSAQSHLGYLRIEKTKINDFLSVFQHLLSLVPNPELLQSPATGHQQLNEHPLLRILQHTVQVRTTLRLPIMGNE